MKKLENVTMYECSFCGKRYLREHLCKNHEDFCTKNPDNIPACYYCSRLGKKTFKASIKDGFKYEGMIATTKAYFCAKYQKFLKPIVSYKKGRDYKDTLNTNIDFMVMPQLCSDCSEEDFQ